MLISNRTCAHEHIRVPYLLLVSLVTSPIDEEGSSAMAGFSKFGFSVSILEAVVSNPLDSY